MYYILVMEDVNKYVNSVPFFTCSCNSGFRLYNEFFSQVYIISFFNNSIESINNCNQFCVNTFESYLCNCQTGYKLYSDNYTCIGMILV